MRGFLRELECRPGRWQRPARKETRDMVTAILLVNVERNRIAAAARDILEIRGVKEVYSVAGEFDLVAIARVSQNDKLAQLVTEDLIRIEGITRTQTLISFRQYSDYDLEKLFEVTW
jgi:DNA-binding Lrp family transcriptional regulator